MKTIKLEIKSLNKKIFLQYKDFLINFLKLQNIKASCFILPIKKKRITLLKSPHVYKKARDQFELKQYKFVLENSNVLNISIIKFFKIILLNKPKLIMLKLLINRKIV